MELILVRHAQTHSNVTRALDTALPGADLTDLGVEQAAALTELLARQQVDAVFCSPALRTRRTAAGIAAHAGVEPRVRDGLVEIAAGDWEMSTATIDGVGYRGYVVRWLQGDLDARIPGGESGHEVLARYDAVVAEARAAGLDRVVVVSHGAVLRAWCGARVSNLMLEHTRDHLLGNTSVVRLQEDGEGWVATHWDEEELPAAVGPEETRIRRLPDRQVREEETLHAILDAAYVAHVAVVEKGQPYVLPMACARDGDSLLLHGSSGSRLMRALAAGAPTSATVTHVDGLVYSRSAFESSMNYRSATVLGRATEVSADAKLEGLRVLTEHLFPGRWAELRAPHRRELAATLLVRLPLETWSVKVADGFREDPPEDLDQAIWSGVVPLAIVAGTPLDAPDLAAGLAVPGYVPGPA